MTCRVTQVEPRENAALLLSLSFGSEQRVFGVSSYFDKGIFTELAEPNDLGQAKPFFGGVGWPHGQDFSADTLYLESQLVGETVL